MRLLFFLLPAVLTAQSYDVVLKNGRVLDPESGLDGVRNIGIAGKQIAIISTRPLAGKVAIDATGLVVAPGFIDLHSHGQTPENHRYKAMDGVTTALDLERGASPVSGFYATRERKALIHFGASADYISRRMAVMKDTGTLFPRDAARNRLATPEERAAIETALQTDLDEGALGLGLSLNFSPTATAEEILYLFQLAARARRTVFVHLRDSGPYESLQEVIANSAISGASLHIEHVNTFLSNTPAALRVIEGARSHRLDITTEALPYAAASMFIDSAAFEPGWQQRLHIGFSDLQWPGTAVRLDAESFERYRKQGGRVFAFLNTEEMVRAAVTHPHVMIASDGILENGQGHPRSAGTYSRIFGRYVREEKALSIMDAVRKCSLEPAQRLEQVCPDMRKKGRLRAGADADISVFDPERVIDKATYEKPAEYSEGFRYVLVNGTFVVRDGRLQDGVAPGQPIRAK